MFSRAESAAANALASCCVLCLVSVFPMRGLGMASTQALIVFKSAVWVAPVKVKIFSSDYDVVKELIEVFPKGG
ncbi:MAG: hypothetical protein AAB347_00085 [Bacteroidota bacterium]